MNRRLNARFTAYWLIGFAAYVGVLVLAVEVTR